MIVGTIWCSASRRRTKKSGINNLEGQDETRFRNVMVHSAAKAGWDGDGDGDGEIGAGRVGAKTWTGSLRWSLDPQSAFSTRWGTVMALLR